MKNIRNYNPEKYNEEKYKKVKENIYEITKEAGYMSDSCLKLKGLKDEELAQKLRKMEWKKCETEIEEYYSYLIYEGQKYYKEIDDEKERIWIPDEEEEKVYLTSIVFEQEPEYGENEPTSPMVSQYPLEDILDKFYCYCYDEYKEENKNDKVNSYVEFASNDIKNIEKLLTIVGKHVYNKENGEYVDLIIE